MRGAIFDVDGTLLDSMDIWDHAGEWYLSQLHITAPPKLGKLLFPMTMEQAAEYMREQFYLDQSVAEIVAGVTRTVEDFYRLRVPAKEGVKDFLDRMKSEGFVMTIATSSQYSLVEAALSRLGILGYFEEIFTCSGVGAGKEEAGIYEAARRYMGTERGQTWVFEDALFAVRTARTAGFPVAAVYDRASEEMQETLKKEADCYLRDFCDFNAFYRTASGRRMR